jgi:hypothetical protein
MQRLMLGSFDTRKNGIQPLGAFLLIAELSYPREPTSPPPSDIGTASA